MKTDIEIAQEAVMEPIERVAEKLEIGADDLELYGKYKAKLSEEFMASVQDRPDGKLILVTAINPTPAGEGKTTASIALMRALARRGLRVYATDVDHVEPHDGDWSKFIDPTNLQSLCHSCHSAKTIAESRAKATRRKR